MYLIDDIEKITKEEKSSFKLGQKYQGGIIFYIDETGEHGLICAPNDIRCDEMWGRNSITNANSPSDGEANTKLIIKYFTDEATYQDPYTNEIVNGSLNHLFETAAYTCDSYELYGYDDWYLPAIDELVQMYLNRKFVPNLNYGENGDFCSSTEYGNKDSYNVHFRVRPTGVYKFYYNKNNYNYLYSPNP
ncbi:MAG: hypothetical protein WCQ95_04315 [Bacteroidota bacterium]